MVVDAEKVCRGARYQNLWWVEEPNQQMDRDIQFLVYWEALQVVAIAIPRVSPYLTAKYQRILHFSIGPHFINIQVRWDPNKQWLPFHYKVTIEELDAIFQEWLTKW